MACPAGDRECLNRFASGNRSGGRLSATDGRWRVLRAVAVWVESGDFNAAASPHSIKRRVASDR
jgi:hypothetical protein